jgi:hypothetical protein
MTQKKIIVWHPLKIV